MTDPVTTSLIVAGAKRLGSIALEWAKGDTTQRVTAALAGRVDEDTFRMVGFASLERDDQFRQFIENTRSRHQFDEEQATEIVRVHVTDIRGDAETDQLVGDVVGLIRSLLVQVTRGGDQSAGLAAGMAHQDAVESRELLLGAVETINDLKRMTTPTVEVVDRRWLGGRASVAWSRLIETDPGAAADFKRRVGDPPSVRGLAAFVGDTEVEGVEVWELAVATADELGDWELLEQSALRFAQTPGADRVRGLAWAAGAADLAGNPERRDELLDEARAIDAQNPSLLLVQARLTTDPDERLAILARVQPIDQRQEAALAAAQALAHYEREDFDAAFAAVERAKEADVDELLALEVEATLIVRDAQSGKAVPWGKAEIAIADLTRIRERLIATERYELSAEIAGKIAQVHLLFANHEGVLAIEESLLDQERDRIEATNVAAALLAAGEAAKALQVLPTASADEHARFVTAMAWLSGDKGRFRTEAIDILDELLSSDDLALRAEAAWARSGATLLDEPAPESPESLAVLEELDPVRARLFAAASKERDDPAAAEDILAAGGEHPELLIERGRLAAKRDDWPTAIILYERAVALDRSAINQLALADALREAGREEEAVSLALTVAQRGINSPGLRRQAYRLAYGVVQRTSALEAQATLAEEWLAHEANEDLAWSYVWTLVRLARYRDARSVIERFSLRPQSEDSIQLYADVLIRTEAPEQVLLTLLALSEGFDAEIPALEARIAFATLAADRSEASEDALAKGQERVDRLADFLPKGGLQQFEIDPADPLREIRPHLERRAEYVAEVEGAVTRGKAPLAALAAATGQDIGSLLLGLNFVRVGFGNSELDDHELNDARAAVGARVVVTLRLSTSLGASAQNYSKSFGVPSLPSSRHKLLLTMSDSERTTQRCPAPARLSV